MPPISEVPPTTTALERDHYDLVFHLLAVRNTARFTPAVLPKPAGAMHDWEIFRDLTLGLLRRSGRPQSWKRWATTQGRMRLSPPSPTVKTSAARVPGTAIFMASSASGVPSALLHNIKHNKVLHERNVILTVDFADDRPYVDDAEGPRWTSVRLTSASP